MSGVLRFTLVTRYHHGAVLKRGVCVALLICGWSLEAAAAISISPSPLDAGSVLIGGSTTSPSGTLSSSNNVHADLVVTNNCTGGGGTFTLSDTSNLNLNPSVSITVTYVPSARGTRTCRVDVFEAGNMNFLGSFNVRGTGLAPPTMTSSGNPDFGAVRWNNAAPVHTFSRTFTVSNTGDDNLDVSAAITGTNAADYTITAGGTMQTVAPGGAKSWTILFDPAAAGLNRSATLTFSSNDPNNPSDTFSLVGDGTNGVITTPTDTNFGIVNIGSSALGDVQVTNTGGAPKGPLGVTSATITGGGGWITFAGCGGGTSCTFAPALSIVDATALVGVRCSPPGTAAANDSQTATITFVSDTDGATPDNTAMLSCVAGKSAFATSLNTVTFGSNLVGTTTAPQMITVTNTGNVAASFYFTKTGSALNQTAFTVMSPAGCGTMGNPCNVPANNGTATVVVTFTALYEGDINAGLTLSSSTVTPAPQLVLTGRGIDRHINIAETMVQFPDTFRNPGDMATSMPITVRNIGEYPLKISGVAIDGAGNWKLAQDFVPFEIEGLGSHNIDVLFTPVAAGKAPDGTLAVVSDDPDPARKTLNVIVSGNGKDRNVSMKGPIDFGNTGAGVPVKLTAIKMPGDWLTVENHDDTTFKIRSMTFDMPEVFKVQTIGGDDISNVELVPGMPDQFEIVFLPPKVGDYTANLTLFLDQDPLGQRTIEVHGNALFVDAHGGGGCSTGRGAGGGLCVVLLALLRRKRRRA